MYIRGAGCSSFHYLPRTPCRASNARCTPLAHSRSARQEEENDKRRLTIRWRNGPAPIIEPRISTTQHATAHMSPDDGIIFLLSFCRRQHNVGKSIYGPMRFVISHMRHMFSPPRSHSRHLLTARQVSRMEGRRAAERTRSILPADERQGYARVVNVEIFFARRRQLTPQHGADAFQGSPSGLTHISQAYIDLHHATAGDAWYSPRCFCVGYQQRRRRRRRRRHDAASQSRDDAAASSRHGHAEAPERATDESQRDRRYRFRHFVMQQGRRRMSRRR